MPLDTIIEKFNSRYNNYKMLLQEAEDMGDGEAAETLSIQLKELGWCCSEVQSEQMKESGIYPPTGLESICAFKKYKGLRWVEVIDENPGYVEWCLKNVSGFQFDEEAHNYFISKGN